MISSGLTRTLSYAAPHDALSELLPLAVCTRERERERDGKYSHFDVHGQLTEYRQGTRLPCRRGFVGFINATINIIPR